jgi:hypothetical protein
VVSLIATPENFRMGMNRVVGYLSETKEKLSIG